MKNFISLQKRKGLNVPASDVTNTNDSLVHMLNHEIMKYGYVLTKDLFQKLAAQSEDYIQEVYNDLLTGIRRAVGQGSYELIYKNFPQSVVDLTYMQFARNAIQHYWSNGTWRPADNEYLNREFKIEPVDYKNVSSLTENEFNSIFTDILYSGASISAFDKEVINWFIENQYAFEFDKISFKETAAYVGQRLLNDTSVYVLPTSDATNVLRIWAAYSGGDEGLKTATEFKNPSSRQRKVLLRTIEAGYNLEESFKIYREEWLRLLFYLNPMTNANKVLYPNTYKHAYLLRNDAKQLKTFNSKIEELFGKKDKAVLDLLKTRKGVFARRLDHAVRTFGIVAVNKFMETNPNLLQLVNTYNHFTDRDKQQAGRGVVLASQNVSQAVTFDAQEPLDTKLVKKIKKTIFDKIKTIKSKEFVNKKIFIDRSLYFRPLAINNRASSLSLDGKVNGTVEVIPAGKTIRMYVNWEDRSDIDLSAFVISTGNNVEKVGWNGHHTTNVSGVVYSGDNTGIADKNAEYIDITVEDLATDVEWIVTDATIFHGHNGFNGFKGGARAGWMLRDFPEANNQWLPDTIAHSQVLNSTSNRAYLTALHVPTRSLVYLDLSMGSNHVTDANDAIKMRMYLETFVSIDNGKKGVNWDKINQGHILNVLSEKVVNNKKNADLIFSEDTAWESVSKYI